MMIFVQEPSCSVHDVLVEKPGDPFHCGEDQHYNRNIEYSRQQVINQLQFSPVCLVIAH